MAVKNTKSLATLLRLAKFELDEKQRELSACYQREEAIIAQMLAADEQLKKEKEIASQDPIGVGRLYGAYHQRWHNEKLEYNNQLLLAQTQTYMAQEDLAEVFRRTKTIETAKDNREQAAQEEENQKEQIALDEIGLNSFRRKNRD